MLDTNLMFSSAQNLTATGFSTNALDIGKTPADGVWVELIVTAVTGTSPTLVMTVYTKDTDASWATTDRKAGVQQEATITAAGRHWFRIQTKNRFVKAHYVIGGTSPDFTFTSGIASGPGQSALVSP